jgi:hypothetical protein
VDVPIIFNSAFSEAGSGQDIVSLYQPFAYLNKGGRMTEFIDAVNRAVAHFANIKRSKLKV